MKLNLKTQGIYSSSTVEPRTPRLMRSLDDPRQGCPNMRAPHLMGGGLSSSHRKTATEIMMGEESSYRQDMLSDHKQAQHESGHPNVMSYYHVLKTLPRTKGVVQGAREHVNMLEMFDAPNRDMYYSEKDEFFVDDWSIQTHEL